MEDAGKAAVPLLTSAQQLGVSAEVAAKAAGSGAGGFCTPLLGGGAPFGAAAQLAGAADAGQGDVGDGEAASGLFAGPGWGEGGVQPQPGPQGVAAGVVCGARPQVCGMVLGGYYPGLQGELNELRQAAQGNASWEQIEDPLLAADMLCKERGLEARVTAEKHLIRLDTKAAAEASLLPFKPSGVVLVDVQDAHAPRQEVPDKIHKPRLSKQPGPHFGLRHKAGREELWYRSGVKRELVLWSVEIEIRYVAKELQPAANRGHGDGGGDGDDVNDDEELVVGKFTAVGPKLLDAAKRAAFSLLAGMAAGTRTLRDPPAFWRLADACDDEAQRLVEAQRRMEAPQMADTRGPGTGKKPRRARQ
ncbi:hypothetical protein MNEG_9740 [Monoraphidium neglectum]|uniref:Uncharacterized protein n=1 Tax=Monoraphidium neglectum TaxID=145388 RepID=A0A0D2MV48_9CHLO|nr:hypothetical protein MNEG_9740 [Monoraphidium neglectum]KIY98220.1 hypothetical protein MNEG_9740 [Monoraphidium neglectum]|eukprot:XP_013897240.1 hypothetical protein MNEG_9740 [Monoraphidium neglectum]